MQRDHAPTDPAAPAAELPRATPRGLGTVTGLLLLANVGVYLAMVAGTGEWSFRTPQLLDWGGNLGEITLDGQLWRLFSAVFIHANLQHIFANAAMLAITGPVVERRIGPAMTLFCFLFCGLCGSVASALGHPDVVSVGASGAIAGLLGAMVPLYFAPGALIVPGAWLLQTIGINALFSFAPGVDGYAHGGGFLAGLVCGGLLAFRPRPAQA